MKQLGELGAQIARYRQRPLRFRDLFILYIPGGMLVLGPLAYGAFQANYAFSHYGPAAASVWSRPWYLLSLTALFFVVLAALNWLRKSRRFIAIYENGLVLALPRLRTFRWEGISGITVNIRRDHFLGIPLRTRCNAVLYPAGGKPIQIKSFNNLADIVDRIKAKLYPRLLPDLQEIFAAGQWLHFGPISIQTSSCQIRTRQIAWGQVSQLSVRSGELVVELESHSKIRLPASEIPNLEILLQIIQTGVNT